MSDSNEKPDKHLEGEGHAHHRFNPERAEEFRDSERLQSLKLAQLTEQLKVQTKDHVLDLGTGSGALLPFLSGEVSEGLVVGADVSEEMLDMSHEHLRENNINNVLLVQNQPKGVCLHDSTIDGALIVSSLHEFSDPQPMLSDVHRVLRPGGRLGILEWRHEETPEGPPLDHRLKPETLKDWFKSTGFDAPSVLTWTQDGLDLYLTQKLTA
jgi:ubiquinone/menaquinone biosynthesis C-methylase UbiE